MELKDVISSYARYAPVYDAMFGRVLHPGRIALGKAAQQLNPATLLEVGVGTGLVLPLYPRSSEVVGVDVSQAMLDKAACLIAAQNLSNCRVQCYDGNRLPFDDNSFDCVTLPYVYSVTPDPKAFIADCMRVCKPGGTLYLLNHFSGVGSGFWPLLEKIAKPIASRIGFHSDFDYTDYVTNVCAAQGWRVSAVETVNFAGLSRLLTVHKA